MKRPWLTITILAYLLVSTPLASQQTEQSAVQDQQATSPEELLDTGAALQSAVASTDVPQITESKLIAMPDPVLFDQATLGFDSTDTADRTNFWKILGLLISPQSFTEGEDGTFKITSSPSQYLNLSATLTEPKLRDPVQQSLDDDEEEKALDDLSIIDDVLFEVKFNLSPEKPEEGVTRIGEYVAYALSQSGARQQFDYISDEIEKQLEESPAGQRVLSSQRTSSSLKDTKDDECSKMRDLEAAQAQDTADADQIRALREQGSRCRAAEMEYFIAHQSYRNSLPAFNEEAEKILNNFLDDFTKNELGPLYRAYRNQLNSHITGRYHSVDELIGQESYGVSANATWGFPRIPEESFKTREQIANWLVNNRDKLNARPHSFAVEFGWTEKRAIEDLAPDLDIDKFQELKFSFNWSTKLFQEAVQIDGFRTGIDSSFTVTYLRPNEDFANERIVVNETLTFHLREKMAIPLSITYASKDELIDEDYVRGHVGFSFSLKDKDKN